MRERPRDEWRILDGLTMPVVLMPATVIQWQAGHFELFSLRPDPVDPTRTRCRCSMLVPADRADETELWERNWTRLCETIPAEDFAVAEQVQRNIDAGSAPSIRIGANEHMLVEHLRAVDRRLSAPGDDGGGEGRPVVFVSRVGRGVARGPCRISSARSARRVATWPSTFFAS